MIEKIKEFWVKKKYVKFNRKIFKSSPKNSSSKILVEFNAYSCIHIFSSFMSNFLSKKNDSKIVAFENTSLLTRPLERNIYDKIKWFVINIFNLKTIAIYKSFGVAEIFYPKINNKIEKDADEIFSKIYQNLDSKDQINSISISGINIGDLIIDGYIKYKKTYKINIKNDDFKKYLLDFIKLFLFWDNYFHRNKISAVMGSLLYYSTGIVYRIAVSRKVDSYIFYNGKIIRLKEGMILANDQYKSHKLYFNNFSENQKKECREIAKNFIKDKLDGNVGAKINELSTDTSSFANKFNNELKILKKSKKIKVLIATHEIFDACHVYGKNYFCDFQSWLYFLGEISNTTDYEWYIKDHPHARGKRFSGQQLTALLTDEIVEKYPNIKLVDPNVSHHQLITEGIDFVLTVYGTITWEYALFNKPIILATNNSSFKDYNFCIKPKNKEDYKNYIKTLNSISKNINFDKDDIYEFYFMQYVFANNNFIIKNYDNFLNSENTFYDYYNYKFYDYYINNYSEKDKEYIFSTLENFFKGNDYILNVHHTNLNVDEFLKNIKNKEQIWKK